MTELSSDTVLTRAPSLSVDLGPPTTIRVGKKQLASVPNALAILEEFAHGAVPLRFFGQPEQVKPVEKLTIVYTYRVQSQVPGIEIVAS
jgi:hypothetical protein